MRFISAVVFPDPEFPSAKSRKGSDGSASDSACGKENSGASIARMSSAIYQSFKSISNGSPSCNVSVQHAVSNARSCSRGACAGALSKSNRHASDSLQHLLCRDESWQMFVIVRSSSENAAPIYLGVYDTRLVLKFEHCIAVGDDVRACWPLFCCACVLERDLHRASSRDQHSSRFTRRHCFQIVAAYELLRMIVGNAVAIT